MAKLVTFERRTCRQKRSNDFNILDIIQSEMSKILTEIWPEKGVARLQRVFERLFWQRRFALTSFLHAQEGFNYEKNRKCKKIFHDK